jgi:copper chaperone
MTYTEDILIENLKCGGCQATIKNTLKKLKGVEKIEVNEKTNHVTIVHDESITRRTLTRVLKKLGYPENGTVKGLDKILTQGKSYLSCAIGRISDDKNEW